jgi:hypothetical protein
MAPISAGNGGTLAGTPAGVGLAGLLVQAAGPGQRYVGLDDDVTVSAMGRWEAMESWCSSRKLAAIRELIRRNPLDGHDAKESGGLPGLWRESLTEEVALELGISKRAAGPLIMLAWTLEARLPLTAAALDDGTLSQYKAQVIAEETHVLSDADAAAAEALIAGQWEGKTPAQLRNKAARAVVQVDPDGAQKRREEAEREQARVEFWRQHGGTAALAGYGLPTDAALMANANIQNRALAYKAHGVPGTLDQLRVLALLDSINGTDARTRYPQPPAAGQDTAGDDAAPGVDGGNASAGNDNGGERGEEGNDGGDGPGGNGSGPGGNGGNGGNGPEAGKPAPEPGFSANTNMTIPLLSLLGLAERAGEAHGLGVIDPDLARRLAAAAASNPRSNWGVIVTDPEGRAIGYGQARATKRARDRAGPGPPGNGKLPRPGQGGAGGTRDGTITFTPAGPGPPDGYGAWILTIGDLVLTVKLAPIPVGECDHRHESRGYQPSDTLRRLVEIRDGKCTLPICGWHPKGCDWEHAVPWPEGRTCTCNGGCRCRHDHRVKQSPGWKIKQLPGGYHHWTTPSGKTYTSEPYRYPI